MAHELRYLQNQPPETLSIILIGGGVSFAVVVAFALYVRWRGRHVRADERRVREDRKSARKRRRR